MNPATLKSWYRLHTTRKDGTVGTRRKTDWIQFAVLLLSILTMLANSLLKSGKLMQQLEDLARQEQQIEQRLANVEEQWLRFQATHK
jgi:heme exporter protein D